MKPRRALAAFCLTAALVAGMAACSSTHGSPGPIDSPNGGNIGVAPPETTYIEPTVDENGNIHNLPSDSPKAPESDAAGQPSELLKTVIIETQVFDPMFDEIEAFWNDVYANGLKYTQPTSAKHSYLYGSTQVTCAGTVYTEDDETGPFYCSDGSDVIAVPTWFVIYVVQQQLVTGDETNVVATQAGEAGIFLLLAHEWSHNVQHELLTDWLKDSTQVEQENTADCMAGVTMAGVDREFNASDVNAILALSAAAGEPASLVASHGTPEQRRQALAQGLKAPYGDAVGSSEAMLDCIKAWMPSVYPKINPQG
jgi:predicted metalloprotease